MHSLTPSASSQLIRLAKLLAGATFFLGTTVFAAWSIGADPLRATWPRWIAMNPVTAIGFIIAGAAAYFWTDAKRPWVTRALGLCLIALGLLRFSDLLAGTTVYLDRRIFKEQLAAITPHRAPSQMAANAALNFFLLGVALAFGRGRSRLTFICLSLVTVTCLTAIAAFTFGLKALYGLPTYLPMALHTAFGFLLVCHAIVLADRKLSADSVLFGSGLGGKLARQLLLPIVTVPLVAGVLQIYLHNQGYYTPEFGLTIFCVASVVLTAMLVIATCRQLNVSDAERTKAENEVKRSREFVVSTLDTLSAHVAVLDETGRIVLVNEAWRRFGAQNQGNPAATDEGANYLAVCDHAASEGFSEAKLLAAGIRDVIHQRTDTFELEYPCHSATALRWFLVRVTQSAALERHIVVAHQDISTMRIAVEALRTSEERFRIVAQSASSLIYDWDIETNRLTWFGDIDAVLGYEKGEIPHTLEAWEALLDPEERPWVMKGIYRCIAEKSSFYGEYRVRAKTGEYRHWSDRGECVVSDGKVRRFIGSCTDTTDRRIAELRLRESERRFRNAFEHSGVGMALVTLEGRFASVNQALCEIVGYSEQELTQLNFRDITFPADLEADLANVGKLMRGEIRSYQIEKRYAHKTGRTVHVLLCGSIVRDDAGEPLYFIAQVQDISAEKIAAAERDRFFTLSMDMLCIAGQDGMLKRVNPAFTDTLGWSEAELRSRPLLEFVHPDDRMATAFELHRLERAEEPAVNFENRYLCRDGSVRWIWWSSRPFPAESLIYAVGRDITEMKARQEQLLQSLRQKDLLLREIHHRVKNNLQVMSSLLQLQARHAKNPAVEKLVAESQARLRAMAMLHEKLYRQENMASVNVASYVTSLVKTLAQSVGRTNMLIEADPSVVSIETALPLGLIINEVVSNSLKHAMPEGGGEVRIALKHADGEFRLTISDNGPGLPPGFDVSRAETLGLRLIGLLATQLGGQATFKNENGLTFCLVFKVANSSLQLN